MVWSAARGPRYDRWMDAAGTPCDAVGPVTAADVELAVVLPADSLNGPLVQDSRLPAGGLDRDRREPVERMQDGLFAYAGQLGPRRPPRDTYVPFAWKRPPGGP